ncbi:MAG: gluconokinase [Pyrinomonadaceae bacterium]
MDQSFILALDIGTSSVRTSLYDAKAQPIKRAFAKIERTLITTADGGAEIDADEALAQVAAAIDAVLKKTRKLKGEIDYVASCSFWHSLVGVDSNGKPTTKVFGWADTRSRKYTEVLRKKFDETETHNRTGARFHSSFWPAKLLWLRKDFPDIFAKTDRWLSFSDYVFLKLFGDAATSVSMASGTGIFDIRRCVWDSELMKFLKAKPSSLPHIVDTDADTFCLNKKYSKCWPRLSKAQWFPAIADGAADNIGAGCVTRSKAALMVGTSGAMRVAYSDEPPKYIPDGLWCYRIDRKRVIIGGALSDGGNLYAWLTTNLRLPKNVEELIAKRPTGAHGLTFLPFLAGERSTGYNESATGAILGLTSSHDAVDILQAALEAVAYQFTGIYKQLDLVVKIEEMVASGGALRESPLWTQIIADVLGHDLSLNDASESSSRGAVLLALESIGKIESIES